MEKEVKIVSLKVYAMAFGKDLTEQNVIARLLR